MDLGYLAAVVVLGGIILFHEFGHYLLARLNGIAVVEFSVGFGPRLLSWVSQKTGIRYSLKLLPLGGSCAMLGEFGEDEDEKEEVPDVKGVSFFDKGPLAKMAVIDSLKMIAGGKVSTNDIAGPVRIVTIIDQTVEENTQYGFVTVVMNLLNLMVMFSANLGVMNLLPFPALDGGRLVFLLWELVTRQPVSQRVESAVNMAGMALLMTFMVFVVFNDLRMIF